MRGGRERQPLPMQSPVKEKFLALLNVEDKDLVSGSTSEELVAITRPGAGDNPGKVSFLGLLFNFLIDVLDVLASDNTETLAVLEVPNLDGVVSGNADPIVLGGESKSVDGVVDGEIIEDLSVGDIPKDSLTVLTTRGAESAIGGDSEVVDGTGVAGKGGGELNLLNLGGVPKLNGLIPAGSANHGGLGRGGEADAGDPVIVSTISDSEGLLVLTNDVPDTDGLIATG